jgi:hypothetical protein
MSNDIAVQRGNSKLSNFNERSKGEHSATASLRTSHRARPEYQSTPASFRDRLDRLKREEIQILINLVAGALGGVGAGKASPTFDLGMIGNIISGLVGGGVLGQIVTLLLPAITAAAQSGNLSIGGIVSQAIAGGAGGAVLTAIIGAIKNRAAA